MNCDPTLRIALAIRFAVLGTLNLCEKLSGLSRADRHTKNHPAYGRYFAVSYNWPLDPMRFY
jgi:hypothetical protein